MSLTLKPDAKEEPGQDEATWPADQTKMDEVPIILTDVKVSPDKVPVKLERAELTPQEFVHDEETSLRNADVKASPEKVEVKLDEPVPTEELFDNVQTSSQTTDGQVTPDRTPANIDSVVTTAELLSAVQASPLNAGGKSSPDKLSPVRLVRAAVTEDLLSPVQASLHHNTGGMISTNKSPIKLDSAIATEAFLNSVTTSLTNTEGGIQIRIETPDHQLPVPGEDFVLINSGIAPKREDLVLPRQLAVNPAAISGSGRTGNIVNSGGTGNLSEQMLLQVVDRFVKGSAQELAVTQPMEGNPQQVQLDGVSIEQLDESSMNNTITVIADAHNSPQEVLLLEVDNLNGTVTESAAVEVKSENPQVQQVGVMNHQLICTPQMLEAAIYAIPEQMLSGDDILHGAINQAGISHQNQLLALQRARASTSQPTPRPETKRATSFNGRTLYPCNLCNKSFLHRRSLNRHYKTHPDTDVESLSREVQHSLPTQPASSSFRHRSPAALGDRKGCDQCEKTFSQVSSLNRHKRHHHEIYPPENGDSHSAEGGIDLNPSGVGDHQCRVCERTFKHAASLERHFSIHVAGGKPYNCKHCDKSFRQSRSLKKHMALHASEGYQCPNCMLSFPHRKHLKRHMKTHRLKMHRCKHCKLTFVDRRSLKAHKAVHNEDKPYHCLYCNRAFNKKSSLAKHHETHLVAMAPQPQYLMDIPTVEGSDEAAVALADHLPSGSQLYNQISAAADMFLKTGRLSDVETGFTASPSTSQVIGYSIQTDSQPGRSPKKSKSRKDKKRYRCRGCKKKMKSLSLLRLHERDCAESMPHKCDLCGKRFTRQNNLNIHQRVHTGLKPFKCKYCHKTFSQGGTLTRHERIHTGERPYRCSYCPETFQWISYMKEHEKKHLADSRLYCKTCGMAFADIQELNKHRKVHAGQEKPFRCRFCSKTFRQNSELTSHLRVHTGERPFKCHQCDKAFKYRSNLYEHEFLHKRGYTKRSKGPPVSRPVKEEEITLSVDSLQQY